MIIKRHFVFNVNYISHDSLFRVSDKNILKITVGRQTAAVEGKRVHIVLSEEHNSEIPLNKPWLRAIIKVQICW